MNEILIDVQGRHRVEVPAERGTVHAVLSLEGGEPQPVLDAVVRRSAQVRAAVEELYDAAAGPVTSYAIDQVRTGAQRPWNRDGRQLPLVHAASVSVRVEFSDFTALGEWVSWGSSVEGLQVRWVAWDLTRERRTALEREVRQEAVRDARRQAQDYADALGLGPVEIRRISAPGVSFGNGEPEMALLAAGAGPSGAGSEPRLELVPQEIEVSAAVSARFVVTG